MNVSIEVTAQRLADLMCGAIEGNHMTRAWCGGVTLLQYGGKHGDAAVDLLETGNTGPWYANPALYAGDFIIQVTELDEDKPNTRTQHKVGPGDFVIGLGLMATKHGPHFGAVMADNDDNWTHDVFLQCIALKNVVYG